MIDITVLLLGVIGDNYWQLETTIPISSCLIPNPMKVEIARFSDDIYLLGPDTGGVNQVVMKETTNMYGKIYWCLNSCNDLCHIR